MMLATHGVANEIVKEFLVERAEIALWARTNNNV